MTDIAIGKRFPKTNPNNGSETILAEFNDAFFDIHAYLFDISEDEKQQWNIGEVIAALYVKELCPFLIFKFDELAFDPSLNVFSMYQYREIEAWLRNDANTINLFLVDAESEILLAKRTITINFSQQMRDVLRRQYLEYEDFDQVDNKIGEISDTISTETMLEMAEIRESCT